MNAIDKNGRRVQVPDPIWFEESGFRADRDPNLNKIDWRIFTEGGHVLYKESLWIDDTTKKDWDLSNDKIFVVLLAYADAQEEEKATNKRPRSD